VHDGEVHALVGLNGAGKTTILRLALGMLRADAGRCLLRGRDVRSSAPAAWRPVAHLLGPPLAYPDLTVAENLRIAGRLAGLSAAATRTAASERAVELQLTPFWSARARALSSGNRQRLGIAAMLIGDPSVLVLDEPTTALDPTGVLLVRETLVAAAGRGAAVLLSSHQLDEVHRMADRVTVVHDGALLGQLDPASADLEDRFLRRIGVRGAA
jgi:ABC-2 type transport system ATP-binding protein